LPRFFEPPRGRVHVRIAGQFVVQHPDDFLGLVDPL
jgi:hypothetical protein